MDELDTSELERRAAAGEFDTLAAHFTLFMREALADKFPSGVALPSAMNELLEAGFYCGCSAIVQLLENHGRQRVLGELHGWFERQRAMVLGG